MDTGTSGARTSRWSRRRRRSAHWNRTPSPSPPEDVLLAAEILSPGHEGADRIDKPARYAEWKIVSYWIVDPTTLTIETYTLDGDVYVASGSAAPGAVATLPALTPITLDPGTLLRLW
ncbi:Uma2 family endonuclease [Embleya sp. NPDC020630]|uniref:Uma2 family endonuclease n=1 Tax=Embleya sp. NPDC020630 TaxID=3363979 RepID=UPI0037991B7E